MLFPYIWMISTSLKARGTWYNLKIFPEQFSLENYRNLLSTGLLPRWYLNTIIISVIGTICVAFLSAIAGYAFAKYKFKGRETMFVIILSAIMIPTEMLIIPWYVGIAKTQLIDSYLGVLMPGLVTTFGIYVMRQFMAGIPDELMDAARIDGVSEFGIFWRICMPIARPALAVVIIFTFLGKWNDFLWPLIAINSEDMYTLQVGLSRLSTGENITDWGIIMTGAALSSIPMMIVFMFFQRNIVEGVTKSGLKG